MTVKRRAGRRGTAQIYIEIVCDGVRQPLPFAIVKAYIHHNNRSKTGEMK